MSDILDEADDLLKIIISHDAYHNLKKTVEDIKKLTELIIDEKSRLKEQKAHEDPLEEIVDSIVDLMKGTAISLSSLLGDDNQDLSSIDNVEYFKIRDENNFLFLNHKLELEIFLNFTKEKKKEMGRKKE